jgi:hypothetical protein
MFRTKGSNFTKTNVSKTLEFEHEDIVFQSPRSKQKLVILTIDPIDAGVDHVVVARDVLDAILLPYL